MKIDKIAINTLNEYSANKLLRCQKHPYLQLLIWNYTETVQFDALWDDVTKMCRGLVTDHDGNIVGRAFSKFFNIEENKHTPTDNFMIFDKADGSLGILFHYADEWIIATRGSFTSDQATVAQLMLTKYDLTKLDKGLSYCFEIIYPENRIVVNYGDKRDLIHLATFDKFGNEYSIDDSPFEKIKKYDYTDYTKIKELDWKNSEGFIVRFSNGDRCKIKFENYVDLHRKLSNISEKAVWELICENKDVKEFLEIIPDEFHKQVQDWKYDLMTKYYKLESDIENHFIKYKQIENRKDFALAIKDYEHKGALFSLLDNKSIHDYICKLIKPVYSINLMFGKDV